MKFTSRVAVLMLLAMPLTAVQASILHIWNCTLNEDATVEQIEAASAAWIKAVRTMKGGENAQAFHVVPVTGETGAGQFSFVLSVPDASSWGALSDGESEAVDEADSVWNALAECQQANIFESIPIAAD